MSTSAGAASSRRTSRRRGSPVDRLTLLRNLTSSPNLRVVAQGVNPTAVLTCRGELVRLAGGSGADVEVGDTIVLCPGRMLRDGGARVLDGDEAYTLVEAEIDNLPAALREIKQRLRTELAARSPAPPWLGRRTPAESRRPANADADADGDDKTEDARAAAPATTTTIRTGARSAAPDDAEPSGPSGGAAGAVCQDDGVWLFSS